VFATPPRPLLEQSTYAEALQEAERLGIPGLSKQSWGLRDRILDVERLLRVHGDIVEAHPEVCFAAMNGGPLSHGKRSWNGCRARIQLLAERGIELPALLPGIARAPGDDVLDAAAAAWTADRKARGLARTLPADPPLVDGRPVAIWF
jgi:predicted RNase H-like nuclease